MRRGRWVVAAVAAAGVAAAVPLAALVAQIDRESSLDEARPADVIVILGAAEYRGRPSPVLRARLDHGLDLYRRGIAPRILTTGGAGGDPDFTESEVGRAYLIRNGVPSEAIIIEPEGDSTMYSTAAAGEIMRRMNLRSCVVVSDGYHIFRAKRMLEERGVRAYGSPRPAGPRDGWRHWRRCLRQAAGYVLWRAGIRV
jgi:uncharacterized SAM-binding protein YcdF (DUF218 family)